MCFFSFFQVGSFFVDRFPNTLYTLAEVGEGRGKGPVPKKVDSKKRQCSTNLRPLCSGATYEAD